MEGGGLGWPPRGRPSGVGLASSTLTLTLTRRCATMVIVGASSPLGAARAAGRGGCTPDPVPPTRRVEVSSEEEDVSDDEKSPQGSPSHGR